MATMHTGVSEARLHQVYNSTVIGVIPSQAYGNVVQKVCNGMNALGSVRPSARPFVCLYELSCLNRLTFDLDFWHESRP